MFVNIRFTGKKTQYLNYKFKLFKSNKLNIKKTGIKHLTYKNELITCFLKKFSFQIVKKCTIFIEHLLIRNKYTNLVSKQTLFILYKKHFLDSLTILSILNSIWPMYSKRRCLDIGTGGGFPGFILSIITPQLYFCLIDSIRKKIQFHSKLSCFLELKNCYPLSIRAEILGKIKKHKNFYNLILARAVSDISILIELSSPLLTKMGKLMMMKKIYGISEEIKNSLFSMCNKKIKIKTIIITSARYEGKMIMILKNLN
nr:glucose-inhibited division protein B [Cryptomonas curvata]